MRFLICKRGCCKLKITPYIYHDRSTRAKTRCKAGVFIHDKVKNKVLIVQSRGNLWGLPKGTLEYGETAIQCAIREVKEETGLLISEDKFTNCVKIKNRAFYFYMQKPECEVTVQTQIVNNDVNSLGWIKPECLRDYVRKGYIAPNKHCRIVFKHFLGLNLED